MEITIKIQDKAFTKTGLQYKLTTDAPFLQLKDIIFEKVKLEVQAFNNQLVETTQLIDMSNDFEAALNEKLSNNRLLQSEDVEKQYYKALDAYQKNQFFVFVNNKQYLDLEDNIPVDKNLDILFLKLTPLVGG